MHNYHRTTVLATTVATALLGFSLTLTTARAGQYAKVSDDLQLYYEDAGQGPVMVWVPGWTASTTVFSHQVEHFSKQYRVVTYDPRSQGLSTKTLDHNDYAQHGRDLAGLMDTLALKNVVLVGWSWGCYDSYAYVRARGADNLKALICIDMPPKGFSTSKDDWAFWTGTDSEMAELHRRTEKIGSDTYGFFKAFATSRWMNARELTPAEQDWFARQAMLTPTYAMLALWLDASFSDYLPEAKQLDANVPVLNIVNEEVAPKAIAWIQTNLPHSASFVIKAHMSHWSEPEAFNAGVDDFLAKVK